MASKRKRSEDQTFSESAFANDIKRLKGKMNENQDNDDVPKPALSTDCQQALDDMVEIITRDFLETNSLGEQQRRLRLGPLLKRPLPLSTCEYSSDAPIILTQLLEFVGDQAIYDDYWKLLKTALSTDAQKCYAVTLAQASGSGKTKLSYNAGMKDALVVIIRILNQRGAFTPPWEHLVQCLQEPCRIREILEPLDARRVSSSMMGHMRILIACYVEWVCGVIEATTRRLPGPVDDSVVRLIALRCVRNGRCDDGVLKLFKCRIETLASLESFSVKNRKVALPMVDRQKVDAWCKDLNARLRSHLSQTHHIVISYDEVQGLLDVLPQSFVTFTNWKRDSNSAKGEQDAFYALTCIMSEMTPEYTWIQSMCGTYFNIVDRAKLAANSPLHGRCQVLYPAQRFSAAQMWDSIATYFDIGSADATVLHDLGSLEGRPKFFFDHFWPNIWAVLSDTWYGTEVGALTCDELRSLVKKNILASINGVSSFCTDFIRKLWKYPQATTNLSTTEAVCVELYVAVRLFEGRVTMVNDDAIVMAVSAGILALPRNTGITIDLRKQEPAFFVAILAIGDEIVRNASTKNDPMGNDPVFKLLQTKLNGSGGVVDLGTTVKIKGTVLELMVVWHVIRTVIISTSPVSLSEIFGPFFPMQFIIPESVRQFQVDACFGINSAEIKPTSFHALFSESRPSTTAILYNIDSNAGADVAFIAAKEDSRGERSYSFVLIQCKAQKCATLADCLRSSSVSWQFCNKAQRKNVEACEPVTWSSNRNDYVNLASEYPAVFNQTFRCAFSVLEFQNTACSVVNIVNSVRDEHPVLLCCSSGRAFGPLHCQLISATQGGRPVSSTANPVYLLPQSISAVQASNVVTNWESEYLELLEEDVELTAVLKAHNTNKKKNNRSFNRFPISNLMSDIETPNQYLY